MAESPPGEDVSQGLNSASLEASMTNSDMDVDVDLEELEQSKTCDSGCCDHSCGCKCGSCFCQVRTDIKKNQNQTTYSGEGARGVAIAYNELISVNNNEPGVQALAANFESLRTDATGSLSSDIAPHVLRGDSLPAPASFYDLRRRDAHQSYDEHMRVNIRRLGLDVDVFADEASDIDRPGDHFVSPVLPDSDCDLMFEFDSDMPQRTNSHELPPDDYSRGNASANVQFTGGNCGATSTANRSQISVEMNLWLVVVPECRHSYAYSAAECA
jgi:hypothetical protein